MVSKKNGLPPNFFIHNYWLYLQSGVEVISYEGAFHGWDRLEVPIKIEDPFSNLGGGGEVEIVPDVAQAYESRNKVVRFFCRHL